MTAARLDQIPTSGRFTVDTERSTYDVDVDAHIIVRHDLTREASGEHVDPETFMFDRIECRVGAPMYLELWLGLDDDDPVTVDAVRVTSSVLGITPAEVTV